jgi:hypothetical protein
MPTQTSRTSGVDHAIASFLLRVAGPVDGARGELTRQGAPLFPRFETKKGGPRLDAKKPRALGAARGEVGEPRGVARATRRCDSATPSFIPPLNNKRRAARKPPSDCSVPSPALTISIAQCEAHRDQRDQRWPLSPKRPPAAEASRPPPGHRECNVGATLAHSAWSRRVVKVVAMAVSDERRVVQMIAERGVRFCAPPAARAGAQPWLRGKSAGRACPGLSLRGGGPPESRASISHE